MIFVFGRVHVDDVMIVGREAVVMLGMVVFDVLVRVECCRETGRFHQRRDEAPRNEPAHERKSMEGRSVRQRTVLQR